MRFCFSIFIGLLLSVSAYSQTVEELIMPKYVQGINSPSDTARVPYICRLKLNNLQANKTYRYMARFFEPTTGTTATGEGNTIAIKSTTGEFKRIPSPNLAQVANCGEFTTDAAGTYTGWFGIDAGTGTMFTPGKQLRIRISINNGNNGLTVQTRLNTNSTVTVINFGNTATDGTALRCTPAAGTTAKNFVMLYDSTTAGARPVTGTVVESDGLVSSGAGYAPFYTSTVDGVDKAWGTIIPNDMAGGIIKITHFSFSGDSVAGRFSENGQWPTTGGTTVNTVQARGSGSNVIVLDGNVLTLAPGAPIKLSQQLSFPDLPVKTYGDDDFEAIATASSALPVSFESSNTNIATVVNGKFIHIVGAGSVDITARQTGDDNYDAAAPVIKQLTINKANLSITAENKIWVQGLSMPALTANYSGFKYNDDASDLNPQPQLSTSATPSSALGFYDIEVAGAGSPNYNFTYNWGKLEIVASSQPQTISFAPLTDKTYGDADFNPHSTATSGLTVTYTSSDPAVAVIIDDTLIRVVSPGTTTITAKQAGNQTYDPAPQVDRQLIVRKATLQITAENKSRLVAQPNPTLTIVYSGFVKNETPHNLATQPVISTTADVSSAPAEYVIKVEGATSDNYDIVHVNGKLTVLALPPQQLSFAVLPVKKYGDGGFKLNASASSGLKVSFSSSNPAVATIEGDTAIRITGAGTAEITATQAGDAAHAPATPVSRTLTVQKALLTIRANNASKNEGEANPPFNVTYSGFVNNEDARALSAQPTVVTAATALSVAGTYNLTVEGAASNNYTIQHQKGTLTILPAQGEGQDNVNAYLSAPGQLQVNVFSANDGKVAIQLFDLNGTRLVNTTVSLKKGFNTCRLAIGNVSPGIYNLRIAGNGIMLKQKLVIQ